MEETKSAHQLKPLVREGEAVSGSVPIVVVDDKRILAVEGGRGEKIEFAAHQTGREELGQRRKRTIARIAIAFSKQTSWHLNAHVEGISELV